MRKTTYQPGRSPVTSSAVKAGTESAAQPEFGSLPALRAGFSIPRSTAYELEKAGEIEFVRLRKRGQARGKVLVNLDSVRRYLARCAESVGGPSQSKKPGRRAKGVEA